MRLRAFWISSTPLIAALLAGCTSFIEMPPAAQGGDTVVTPLVVEGRCTLVVSGSYRGKNLSIGQVSLEVYEGIAQIHVGLGPVDAHASSSFHVVVPVEEQHVDVVYIGQPRRPLWERATGGNTCSG